MALLVTAILAATVTTGNQATPSVHFMYFVKGNGARPTDPKVLQKMQADHIANMQKQAELGHLVAAGPCQDPDGTRRGITVLYAKNRAECLTFFKEDPYVQAHIMEVAVAKWKVEPGMFDPKVDPNRLSEYSLLSIYGGATNSERSRMNAKGVGGEVSVEGPETFKFPTEVWITRRQSELAFREAAGARLSGRPGTIEAIPLYMSEGCVKIKS